MTMTTTPTRNERRSEAEAIAHAANLPPITMTQGDWERLGSLAEAATEIFPRTADFLTREVERAQVVASPAHPPDFVTMGSTVDFQDDITAQVRRVTLVYPEEADVGTGKVSVLTPVGAALIGLSSGQSIDFQTPSGGWRSLTLLKIA